MKPSTYRYNKDKWNTGGVTRSRVRTDITRFPQYMEVPDVYMDDAVARLNQENKRILEKKIKKDRTTLKDSGFGGL